jgi:hypothetical protein
MKPEMNKVLEFTTGDPVDDRGPKALYRLPDEIRKICEIYRSNRPGFNASPEEFAEKQSLQDKAFDGIVEIAAAAIDRQGSISQPALVVRALPPSFNFPRYEVRSLDRGEAVPGRPLFVTADPALKNELHLGDVVVLSGDGARIIDMDNELRRYGETATVIGVHTDQDFPYEVELEGNGHLNQRLDAMKWERLHPDPRIGDRVKIMSGFIHAYAPGQSASRFVKNPWRDDLDIQDLHGVVPRRTLKLILSKADKFFNRKKYLNPAGRIAPKDSLLIYGQPGVGKTWTVTVAFSILQRKYNSGKDKVVFIVTEGSAVEGALVGSGPKALREIRSLAKKAFSEGRLPITFINEAGTLLRSREVQGMMLDGGSSLSTHEQFLSMLSGPDEIPGIIIVDLNTEKMLDEATRQRFTCVAYPSIDRAVIVDQMFKAACEGNPDLFDSDWNVVRSAILASLDTRIGTVLVGSETCPVSVGHLVSGRLYEKVIQEALALVNLCIYSASEHGMVPPLDRITPSLLYHTLTQRAWSLFSCWDDRQARETLVPGLVRPEKAAAISKPRARVWSKIEMPAEYDCREMLDDLVGIDP